MYWTRRLQSVSIGRRLGSNHAPCFQGMTAANAARWTFENDMVSVGLLGFHSADVTAVFGVWQAQSAVAARKLPRPQLARPNECERSLSPAVADECAPAASTACGRVLRERRLIVGVN